jgi:hypothetical protein
VNLKNKKHLKIPYIGYILSILDKNKRPKPPDYSFSLWMIAKTVSPNRSYNPGKSLRKAAKSIGRKYHLSNSFSSYSLNF